MLQSSKHLRSAWHHSQLLTYKPSHPPPPPQQAFCSIPICPSGPTPAQSCKVSRRELAIFTNTSLLLLGGISQTLLPDLHAEEEETNNGNDATALPQEGTPEPASPVESGGGDGIQSQASSDEKISPIEDAAPPPASDISEAKDDEKEPEPASAPAPASKRAFLDISIDGKPMGRITVAIDQERTPIGASRFIDLVSGRAGISYRRKEFVKITPNYVQHGGVRSYGVDAEMAKSTGKDLSNGDLIQEWEKMSSESPPGTKNLSGSLGIIVRDPRKPPPKTKLVARQGKLKIEEEEIGVEPNGTEFVIAAKDSPELDDSALVIGRVVDGMNVVDKIEQVKTVQENTTSPYFRVAKLIGDKRAVVAERGFNRPYSKVLVTNCGLLD